VQTKLGHIILFHQGKTPSTEELLL